MALFSYDETVRVADAEGPVVSNTTTTTTLMNAKDAVRFRAGWFRFVGRNLNLRATGVASRWTSGTLGFQVRFNGVSVFTGPLMVLKTNATNVPWILELNGLYRVNSNASSIMWMGYFTSELVVGSPNPTVGGCGTLSQPASAPAVGGTFNCSLDQDFDLLATWSVANPSNSIQMHQMRLISQS